jgi:hypothetical protein
MEQMERRTVVVSLASNLFGEGLVDIPLEIVKAGDH